MDVLWNLIAFYARLGCLAGSCHHSCHNFANNPAKSTPRTRYVVWCHPGDQGSCERHTADRAVRLQHLGGSWLRHPHLAGAVSEAGSQARASARALDPDALRDQRLCGTTNDEDLSQRELSYGKSGFALQFMLDTSLSDQEKHPLKLSDLIVYPCDPFRAPIDFMWAGSSELSLPTVTGLSGDRYHAPMWVSKNTAPYEANVMFIDPSGRGKDEVAYAIVKLLHGRLFLVASGAASTTIAPW